MIHDCNHLARRRVRGIFRVVGGGSAGIGRSLMLALILLSAVALLRAPTLVVPIFNSDEAYLAVQAHVLRDGGRLYHDVADRKPPLVPYLYAATFALVGRDNLIAVHVVAILWLFGTALVLAWDARERSGPRAAAWAAGL